MAAMRVRLVTFVLAVAAVVGACAGGSDEPVVDRVESEPRRTDLPADVVAEASVPGHSEVARPSGPVAVHAEPSEDAPQVTVLDPHTTLGSARALLVLEQRDGWARVALPVRPNGSEGWIRLDGVEVRPVTKAVVVDLEARVLRLHDAGEVVLETPVAVGSAEHETPRGRFFVTDTLETPNPHGPYGPYAFGISAHSDTLTEFAGGEGQVGIHGTDDPSSIGQPVSHGCVRVPNDVARHLAAVVPLGTPVIIVS